METNVYFGTPVNELKCKVLDILPPSLTHENQAAFMKALFNAIHQTVHGYFDAGRIYFIGDENRLLAKLNEIKRTFVDFNIIKLSDKVLTTNTDLKIMRNIIYSAIEDFLRSKGFLVRLRKRGPKVAVPTFEMLDVGGRKINFVTNTKSRYGTDVHLIESFKYIFHLFPDGKCYFQIDPKLTVLIPAHSVQASVLQNTFLISICFADSQRGRSCEFVTKNVMKFVQYSASRPTTSCESAKTARRFYEVLELKNKVTMEVPENVLFVEGHPAQLGMYREVRSRAVKEPAQRKEWTKIFMEILSGGEEDIIIPLGNEKLKISSKPHMLDFVNISVTVPFQAAMVLGEPRLIFTDQPSAINPKEGLLADGPFSRNNSSLHYHPDKVIIHVVYPSPSEHYVKDFFEILKSGCLGQGSEKDYPGFNLRSAPFYSDLMVAYYPQTTSNLLLAYKTLIATLKDKVDRKGNVLVFVMPREGGEFYPQLKALCYQHSLPSQMVREGTLRKGYRASILWNLALAVYTKAGGTPWKLDSEWLKYSECYIGIQTKVQRFDKVGRGGFFIGSADIFNRFGEYISCAVHQGVARSFDRLHVDAEFMKNLIMKAAERYKQNMGDYPQKIVIHRQIDFNKIETQGLLQGLQALNISPPCILVHLQENHIFRGYRTLHPELKAPRTTYFLIGRRSAILFTTGVTEGVYEGFGTPKPTQVNIRALHANSILTEEDVHQLCKGIIGFTRLRWNTTRIGIRRPLTIFAADRIGELAKAGYTGLEYRDVRDVL
ncbi:MAG: hypothetical protein QW491_13600 [Thermoproteota archaeon]|nr:hypothetical protein [Candidatus Brockarchaeota archaeon]